MPELTEVERVRKTLSPAMRSKIICMNKSEATSVLRTSEFSLAGKVINSVRRHGKYLIFDLSTKGSPAYMLSHLGMTGTWSLDDSKEWRPYLHFQLELVKEGKKLWLSYTDRRRFGNIFLVRSKARLNTLGPDMLSKSFNKEWVDFGISQYPKKELKPFLMMQYYFPGLGNYMASEVCARACILPTRKLKMLSKKDTDALWEAIKEVVRIGMEEKGLPYKRYKHLAGARSLGGNCNGCKWFSTCQDSFGVEGNTKACNEFEDKLLLVYKHERCERCGSKVKNVEQDKRMSWFCKKCQK